jgi:hypothetical protein
MSILFNLIFHGPWGFVVDDPEDPNPNPNPKIRAFTPDCNGHQYLMGDDVNSLQAMAAGTYTLANPSDVDTLNFDENKAKKFLCVDQHSRFEIPAADDKRWRCAFELPRTLIQGVRPATRGQVKDNYDDLLSGRHYHHLSSGDLALCQVIQFNVPDHTKAVLKNGDALWRASPLADGATAVNLKIYAKSVSPGGEDHFAMMAQLFNYDLYLDGNGIKTPKVPLPDQSDLPDGVKVDDVKDLGEMTEGSRTAKYPIVCGGNFVVFYQEA